MQSFYRVKRFVGNACRSRCHNRTSASGSVLLLHKMHGKVRYAAQPPFVITGLKCVIVGLAKESDSRAQAACSALPCT